MKMFTFAALTVSSVALAENIDVVDDIVTSETWTADNVYNLTTQIYVRPGATLTIQGGTRVVSTATANGSGALCVTNGAQLFVNGDSNAPVVMTSNLDDGTWRASCNEWGNLTICGDAYIGFDGVTNSGGFPGNTLAPSRQMKQTWKVWLKKLEIPLSTTTGVATTTMTPAVFPTSLSATAVALLGCPTNSMDSLWEPWDGGLKFTTLRS